MGVKRVVLRTAHFLENVWHAAGTQISIPEEHFDPLLHAEAPPAEVPEAKPEGVTRIALESVPQLWSGLHKRIDALEAAVHARLERLEQDAVSVIDFTKLHQRVEALEAPRPDPPPQPPVGNAHVAAGATLFTDPPKEG